MDFIVAACRTLASRSRLRLLRAVYEEPGSTVQALAKAVELPVHAASKHLKLLREHHLIRAMPSGRYVRYALPVENDTESRFLRNLQALMKDLLDGKKCNFTLAQVWNDAPQSETGWEAVFAGLEKHVTTYTHLRRLLILRELARKHTCRAEEITGTIRMSAGALGRHLDKLQRRGVIREPATKAGAWTIVRDARPPCRQRLLEIVLRALQAGSAFGQGADGTRHLRHRAK
jgi:DNA-binding transcriptional ArsR family regulator